MHAVSVWIRYRSLFTWRLNQPRRLTRALLWGSSDFAMISIGLSIIFQFTTGIFGLIVGSDAIVNLGVFMRIMISVVGIFLTVTYPMSNLIAARLARGNLSGAVDTAVVSGVGLLLGGAVAAVGFALFGERLISIWLRTTVSYDPHFQIMSSLLFFCTAANVYATGVAVGFGNVRTVSKVHAVLGVAVLPFAYVCYMFLGQAGILMAMDIVLVAAAAVCLAAGSEFKYLRLRFGF
jgi:Na+-driven multidrug efflux pump